MKVGTKIGHFSDKRFIEEVAPHVDFFEVYIVETFDYRFIKDYQKEVVIHAAHQAHGFNPANINNAPTNEMILKSAIEAADFFGSQKIIIHPGHKENPACTLENIKVFLNNNFDSRIMIENLPSTREESNFFCTEPKEIKEIMDCCNVGFCLDIAHAVEHSFFYKKDPENLLHVFNKLEPSHLHICDTKLDMADKSNKSIGSHLSLSEGDIDKIDWPKYLDKESSITLETPPDLKKQLAEINFLRGLC